VPEPVREALVWLPFGWALVPLVLVWSGSGWRLAAGVAALLAVLLSLCWLALHVAGLSVRRLGRGDDASAGP
jgi:hypothetical protein